MDFLFGIGSLIVAIVGVISSILPIIVNRISSHFIQNKIIEKDDLVERIKKTTKKLNASINEISYLQDELKERINIVEALKKEAQIAENIITLSSEQVKAVKLVLNKELVNEGKKSFWKNFGTNFIFFILGVIVTFLLSIFL